VVLKINIREFLFGAVPDHEARGGFFNGPRRREAALVHDVGVTKKEPQVVWDSGLLVVLPQTLGFYAERPGVSGDGVAARSWPKRAR